MGNRKFANVSMREIHRYIGYFLVGIMAVYALSGIVLIYRDTDFLKVEKQVEKKLTPDIKTDELGRSLRIRDFKILKTEGDVINFNTGTYNNKTGIANYTTKELPFVLNKMTQLHKSSTKQPLYWLNLFFAVSLLFFVVSSFWMFRPKSNIFRKGMYFTIAGIILTLILLFL
jgi:hypothetical protein